MNTQFNNVNRFHLKLFEGWRNIPFDTDAQLQNLLAVGLDYLKLDIAIISRIHGKQYTIEHCVGEGLERGQQFDLGITYCSITTRQNQVLAIHNMAISEHFRHPCYEAFKLETYIGSPTRLNGNIYGTINFSSTESRDTSFTDEQRLFVQLMGEVVNWSLLSRPEDED